MDNWQTFKKINTERRSVRDFDGVEIDESIIDEILKEALLAPSSANIQPFEFHVISNGSTKNMLAKACNNQRAAVSASALIVIVSSIDIAKQHVKEFSNYIDSSTLLSNKAKLYHKGSVKILNRFLLFSPLPIFSPFFKLASLFFPAANLLPIGLTGVRQWCAKSAIFAAQNLFLAAQARGFDTCPMEGFNPIKVAQILNLPYGSSVPLVIALGKKTSSAYIEPQWRIPYEKMVIKHV